MIKLTFVVLGKLIVGAISPKTLAGPIGIAQMSGEVAKAGPIAFLYFLALLSINLGILNLLPIPILDGGHLLFFSIEAIMGKPLPKAKPLAAFKPTTNEPGNPGPRVTAIASTSRRSRCAC